MITGIHHVSMKCGRAEDFQRAKEFYCQTLGLTVRQEWPEGVLLDTGNGLIEIFSTGEGERGKGAVRHFALACGDVDGLTETVRQAGYEVFLGPKDICIGADFPARIAFCKGPLGEEIELFQEL